MLDKRLFNDGSANGGMKEWFVFDTDTDRVQMVAEQDVGDLTDLNVKVQNEVFQRSMKWGDIARVATIPMALYNQWLLDKRTEDQGWLKRWLNNSDNRLFRTRLGRV